MDEIVKVNIINNFDSGEITPLEDIYDLEGVANEIKNLNHQLELQKGYKEKRVTAIQNEINKIENKIVYLKKIIIKTLQDKKENKINFPDVCKLSLRKISSKWVIDDAEVLIKDLLEKKELDKCAEEKKEWKIVKKDLDALLKNLEASENLPKGVSKQPEDVGVTLTYAKEASSENNDVSKIPVKNDYDELEW